ncbi:MAG: hypothetical protein LBD24_01405 [Spirochaetaceae bacterium]|nr:hypothetical protein [Spirochaetaceae bacterium]
MAAWVLARGGMGLARGGVVLARRGAVSSRRPLWGASQDVFVPPPPAVDKGGGGFYDVRYTLIQEEK